MTIQEAFSLAEKFMDRYNSRIPGERDYKWGFDNMIEFTECYYFDFTFLHLNGELNTAPHVAGGAKGFVISKYDGYAKMITHCDLHLLQDEEKRMDDLYALAMNVKQNKGLDTIKSTYKLNTRQLLQFVKILQTESFDRLTVTAKLQEIIKNIRLHKYPE